MLNVDPKQCTGCRACEQICPRHCIRMQPDKNGFLYPVICGEACINCHMCEKACPINKDDCYESRASDVYAAYLKDEDTLKDSASGGMFPALAAMMLERGGVIYGCAWSDEMNAMHIRVTDKKDLIRLQGSKYVQSNTENTFSTVKQDLSNGKYVLYTGTPCQIAGLKLFLGKEYDRLVTVDLICHGVPSPALFHDYLGWLSSKKRGSITHYRFRDKSLRGWDHSAKYSYLSSQKVFDVTIAAPHLDPYYYFFCAGSVNRECCYTCQYAQERRVGDFTIGDFWGIKDAHQDFPTTQGVSVLLVNSAKAADNLAAIKDRLILAESTIENASRQNSQLKNPVDKPDDRERLFELWQKEGFEGIYQAYKRSVGMNRFEIYNRLCRLCPNKIRKLAKRFLRRS